MAAQEPFFGGAGWTEELGQKLQEQIDELFPKQEEETGTGLKQLEFSLTIADPILEGCPLVGCSSGFKTLCGYEMHEIVGRNCRFLVDPVPKERINSAVRAFSREFCKAVLEGKEYRVDPQRREPWMPRPRPHDDGLFCMQTNARKNGDLFENMFYLKKIELDNKPYIVGLQTEVDKGNAAAVDACHKACSNLDDNMKSVERLLASRFWLTSAMRRQDSPDDALEQDGFDRCAATGLLSEEEKRALDDGRTSLEPLVSLNTPGTNANVQEEKAPVAETPPTSPSPKTGGSSCWGACFGRKDTVRPVNAP
jgi:hypothetical protein